MLLNSVNLIFVFFDFCVFFGFSVFFDFFGASSAFVCFSNTCISRCSPRHWAQRPSFGFQNPLMCHGQTNIFASGSWLGTSISYCPAGLPGDVGAVHGPTYLGFSPPHCGRSCTCLWPRTCTPPRSCICWGHGVFPRVPRWAQMAGVPDD